MMTKTQVACGGVLLIVLVGLCGCISGDRTSSDRVGSRTGSGSTRTSTAAALTLDLGGGVKMELVQVPPGQFVMGSSDQEEGRRDSEGPQHTVRIPEAFYLGRHEVTQAEWNAVMPENPSRYKGDDLPVHWVSAGDAEAFCQRLAARLGREVRLPTEAEWEYACRAGSNTAYFFGDTADDLDQYAWYDGHSRRSPNPVGGKQPNAWGLRDILGNVWEWCADTYRPTYDGAPIDGSARRPENEEDVRRVLRGGSWFDKAPVLRSASRIGRPAAMRSIYMGFRVVVR